jgi:uncharacterized protein YggT (Ycf19 family)
MRVIATLIDLYSLIVLAVVALSWLSVDGGHPAVAWLHRVTEPALARCGWPARWSSVPR